MCLKPWDPALAPHTHKPKQNKAKDLLVTQALRRWGQENKKFKVVLSDSSKLTWGK